MSTLHRPAHPRARFSIAAPPNSITAITFSGESTSLPIDAIVIFHSYQLLFSLHSDEPTKTDNDVFKALHNVEIDDKTYPNIHQWYAALENYSLDEREKYVEIVNASPTEILTHSIEFICSFPTSQWKRSNAVPPAQQSKEKSKMNRLFQSPSPVKEISPKFGFQLKPSLLSNRP